MYAVLNKHIKHYSRQLLQTECQVFSLNARLHTECVDPCWAEEISFTALIFFSTTLGLFRTFWKLPIDCLSYIWFAFLATSLKSIQNTKDRSIWHKILILNQQGHSQSWESDERISQSFFIEGPEEDQWDPSSVSGSFIFLWWRTGWKGSDLLKFTAKAFKRLRVLDWPPQSPDLKIILDQLDRGNLKENPGKCWKKPGTIYRKITDGKLQSSLPKSVQFHTEY